MSYTKNLYENVQENSLQYLQALIVNVKEAYAKDGICVFDGPFKAGVCKFPDFTWDDNNVTDEIIDAQLAVLDALYEIVTTVLE